MIVCSCNVLSDEEVRTAARMVTRRAASSVYVCLRCRVRCGRCTRTIREIMGKEVDQLKCFSACNIDPLSGGSASKIDPL
jgi:bacterioferritin-associated ferredoxin